jgi:RNA polymerase sigma-32 factor
MLTRERELELVAAWRERGDRSAQDIILSSHMKLCYGVASRYETNEARVDDLAQSGVFGLYKALETYDPARGTRFSTWARWWVANEVDRARRCVSMVVDMPARTYRRSRSGEDGPPAEWDARMAARGEIPLDAPIGDGNDSTLLDTLVSADADPEAVAAEASRLAAIRTALASALGAGMSAREAEVLRRRSLCEVPETLDGIAADLGVSRERVRQIEAAATGKLRRWLVANRFDRALLSP